MNKVLLIRNGLLVSSVETALGDLLIENGKITQVGANIQHPDAEVFDAAGLYVLPGVIDPQVHFRDPGFPEKEDLYTGSKAAAAGGVTSYFEMPNTKPATIDFDAMQAKKKRAASVSLVNYNFFAGATASNLDYLNTVPNVAGIKIFMGSSTGDLLVADSHDIEKIFAQGRRLIAVHAEDEEILRHNKASMPATSVFDHPKIRSAEAALKATQLAVMLSKKYRRRLHVLHVTSGDEVIFLAQHKDGNISSEVTPQHLFFQAPEVYERLGTFAQMNPPIRDKWHRDALRRALQAGVIDCIATDHAPHTIAEKEKGYPAAPSGMPGVETALPVMLTLMHEGLWTLNQVVRWMCEMPAQLYRVRHKGFLAVGADADITLIDLNKKKTVENGKLQTKVNWSPYHGLTLQGWPIVTIVNGNIVYREGEFFEDIKGREIIIDQEV